MSGRCQTIWCTGGPDDLALRDVGLRCSLCMHAFEFQNIRTRNGSRHGGPPSPLSSLYVYDFFPIFFALFFLFFLISRSSYVDEGCAMRVFHAKINSNKGRAESNCMMLVRMLERCVKGHRFFFIIEFAFSKYVGNWEKYHDLIFFSPCKNSTQFAQARLICIEEFFSSFSLMINLRKM